MVYVGSSIPFSKDFDSFRYISHHGIKGQKWGVRRYQNQDGSLTTIGKARYNSDSANSASRPHSREKYVGEGSASVSKGRKVQSGKVSSHDTKQSKPSKPSKTKVDQWLKENYVYYGHPGSEDYLNQYSDYDNLTVGERMMLDAEEDEKLKKMSPEERDKYLSQLRDRQMDYIKKNVTIDGYQTDHKDGRYNLVDKVREQVTGKLDADNVANVRDSVVNSRRDYLVATHKWSENEEAVAAKRWTQDKLDTAITKMQNNTLRKRGENTVKKIISKLKR